MGIEAIGSIGSALGSVASAIGKGAVPAMAGLSKFGPELKGVYLPKIVNEGPVSLADFKNTMPILQIGKLNPVKEIRFNEPIIRPKVELRVVGPMVMPWVLPDAKTQSVTEVRSASRPAQSVSPKPSLSVKPALEEQEVEELVEESKIVEDPRETIEEEETKESEIFVEDTEVSAQRRLDIKTAILKAKEIALQLGLKTITGSLIARFTPAEYAGVRSRVLKNVGPDGSYQETIEELAGAREFGSATAAEEWVDNMVAEKKPVKYGKYGTPLSLVHIARVLKYRIFKSLPVHEVVVKRVIRKKVQAVLKQTTVVETVVETKTEKSLEQLDPTLASVFQKAA